MSPAGAIRNRAVWAEGMSGVEQSGSPADASTSVRKVRRIAHRAGNGSVPLQAAVRAGVDWIETDLWYQYGRLVARHERAVWRLPFVYDSWRLRPHFRPLYLPEIIDATTPGPGLFLDFKGRQRPLAGAVVDVLRAHDVVGRAAVCGQFWPPLDEIGRLEPRIRLYYSLGRPEHVVLFQARLEQGLKPAGVSIARWLLTNELGEKFAARGLEVYAWTVNEPALALELVARGATGIISDNLDLLAALP
jgi:glycerophosphoryl diester phosphodiesterase